MKKRSLLVLICLCAPQTALAEWRALDGADIRIALTDKRLSYERAWQEFKASGRTLYNAGQDSWGYWRIQDDKYCSQWPPSDLWACYALERDGTRLRFVGQGDDITEAEYADE